jgi:SNF2 family DNA or RNA helicase
MLVVKDQHKVVLNTSINERILEVMPHAKTIQDDGQELVVVPHGVQEYMVLRNLGVNIPPPITEYYDYPARFEPMAHQIETAEFLSTNKRALCLNAPGTGKTISAIWAADYLITCGEAKKILIVAPLSTLKEVWGMELKMHLPHRTFAMVTGAKAKKIKTLETPGVQYFIINHDGFTNLRNHLTDIDVVIYDEATALKTPGTQRYKIFFRWMKENQPWLWMLTGTPISQTPADAWTLARLVESPSVHRSYVSFKETVMQKVSQFKWVPRADALETCKKVLQPSIRFSLDECKDLPATNYVDRVTQLTTQQAKAFKEMQERAIAVFTEGSVAAPNTAVMLSKLLQICCGVVYSEETSIEIDAKDRYNTLTELLNEIGGKAIVFVPLKGVQYWLEEKLTADGYDVALVNGDVKGADRDKIFNDFQHTDSAHILLAHPKVAAHGLTLTRAKDVIWFAPIYSLEQYEQANARIRRISTEGKTNVWHILATKFEAELYRRLRQKQNVLAEFLDLVQGVNIESKY